MILRKVNFLNRYQTYTYIIQNLLPIQKIHFTHLQQYNENHRLPCKNRTSQWKKNGGNVTMHEQQRIMSFCIIHASS